MRTAFKGLTGWMVLAVLAAAPVASASGRGAAGLSASFGIGPGVWLEGGPAALDLAFRPALQIPLASNQLELRVGLPLRFSTYAYDTWNSRASVVGFAVVPALQLGVNVVPRLQLYASTGVGPAFERVRFDVWGDRFVYYQDYTFLEWDLNAGLEYAFDDRLSLFFEPMGLRMFSSDPVSTEWTMLVGVTVGF